MDRNVPLCYIKLLKDWYDKVFISVRWGNSNSGYYKMSQGIRQGGILSPALFAVFVDDILVKLENNRKRLFCTGKFFKLNYVC